MKRYLLFMYSTYYPRGGWDDFIDSYATIDEASIAALARFETDAINSRHCDFDPIRHYDFGHIVDSLTGVKIDIDPLEDLPLGVFGE